MVTKRKKVPGVVVDLLKEAATTGKIREPNLAELAQHFFDMAGGERKVAAMLLAEINRPNCSPSVRSKIIQFMLQHLKYLNEKSGTIDELGVMTDADISRELDKHIREVSQEALKRRQEKEKHDAEHGPDQNTCFIQGIP